MKWKVEEYAKRLERDIREENFRFDFFARFVVIWTLITRIPLPRHWWPDKSPSGNSALALSPLAGGLLGVLTGLAIAAVRVMGAGQSASVWIGVLFYSLAGWSLHLDGWGDMWDGLGSGRRGDDLRSVMKDSRLGAYGAIGLILAFGLWTSLLGSISPEQTAAACATSAAVGRYAMCWSALFGRYPWEVGMAKGWVDSFEGYDIFVASICVFLFLPLAPLRWFFSVLLSIVVGYAAALWMNGRLGGVSGDVLGSVAVAGELLSLAVFAL